MYKEAKRSREQAEELVPTKKKSKAQVKMASDDVVRYYPDVLKDIDIKTVPDHLSSARIEYKNGKIWEVDCNAKDPLEQIQTTPADLAV